VAPFNLQNMDGCTCDLTVLLVKTVTNVVLEIMVLLLTTKSLGHHLGLKNK